MADDFDPIPLATDRDAWERQDDEPNHHYLVFEEYLRMQKRSVNGLANARAERGEKNLVSQPFLSRLSRRWQWEHRARQWDRVEEQRRMADLRRARAQVQEDQAQVAALIRRKVFEAIEKADFGKMRGTELASLFDKAAKIERLAMGLANDRSETTGLDGEPLNANAAAIPSEEAIAADEQRLKDFMEKFGGESASNGEADSNEEADSQGDEQGDDPDSGKSSDEA